MADLHLSHRVAGERGSVIVFVAVAMQAVLLILALALEVGNWYVHDNKLQSRVDDAAFAAAVAYGYRFPSCASDPDLAEAVADSARRFAGVGTPNPVNTEVNDNIEVVVNGADFETGDYTDDDLGEVAHPCFAHSTSDVFVSPPDPDADPDPEGGYWIDVKAREQAIASLFGGFGIDPPTATARARIRLMNVETATQVQPFVVADAADTPCARVRFTNGAGTHGIIELTRTPGTNIWTGGDEVAKDGPNQTATVELGGCGGSDVIAYSEVGYVDRFPDTGPAGTSFGRVELTGDPCNGSYVFRENGSCAITVIVHNVEFGTLGDNPGDPCPPAEQQVLANGVPLFPLGPPAVERDWEGVEILETEPGDGVVPVEISLRCRLGVHDFGTQQSIMAGNDSQEGPIADLTLGTTGFTGGGDYDQTVTLTLRPLRSDDLPTDVAVPIRGAAPAAGNFLSGAATCPAGGPGGTSDAIRLGCHGPFAADAGSCPSGTTCSFAIRSGDSGLSSAYNDAWCDFVNRWSDYPADIPRNDRRLIVVAVTTPGAAFDGGDPDNPDNSEPIERFAAFYVTGWAGASCPGPDPQNDLPPPALNEIYGGAIWGHFIKFVRPPSTGTPADTTCKTESATRGVTACIATLVR
jgi:hypothetical protein